MRWVVVPFHIFVGCIVGQCIPLSASIPFFAAAIASPFRIFFGCIPLSASIPFVAGQAFNFAINIAELARCGGCAAYD